MGGFFGVASKTDCVAPVFFGADYHSHMGTHSGGMAAWDAQVGLQRRIHSIANGPFRTKFEHIFEEMSGTAGLGCISDTSPQPLLIRSHHGPYVLCFIGVISNADALTDECLAHGSHFDAMTGGRVNPCELLSALIDTQDSFAEGLAYAQSVIEGSANILVLTDKGTLIAARDRWGRLPILIGKSDDGYAVAMESFAYGKLGFADEYELGPGEIVEISADGYRQLAAPGPHMQICAFLWTYYGYPTSTYEGVNVEVMRYRNGALMARADAAAGLTAGIDYVGGVPDSGTPHAIGYANESGIPFARPFIKYSPTWQRSFMPKNQSDRNKVARMKQVPVTQLIRNKNLLFVDDSIVRGTQLRETVQFLYANGAKSVHMRSACPPIMFSCKYLNFSRATNDMELLGRRVVNKLEGAEGMAHLAEYSDGRTERGRSLRAHICRQMDFDTLEFQSLAGTVEAIGLPKCRLCTYCWDGCEGPCGK